MGEESIRFVVKKFNVSNFVFWKVHIKDYLYKRKIYQSLGEKVKKLVMMFG